MTFVDLLDATSEATGVNLPDYILRRAIHFYRNELNTEMEGLVVQTVGRSWVYKITHDHEDLQDWQGTRYRSLDTQLKTMLAQAEVDVRHSDGRSTAGRRARYTQMHIGRLIEDLDVLADSAA
jgi:hypothetical protein